VFFGTAEVGVFNPRTGVIKPQKWGFSTAEVGVYAVASKWRFCFCFQWFFAFVKFVRK
jgi:hypothetical protein